MENQNNQTFQEGNQVLYVGKIVSEGEEPLFGVISCPYQKEGFNRYRLPGRKGLGNFDLPSPDLEPMGAMIAHIWARRFERNSVYDFAPCEQADGDYRFIPLSKDEREDLERLVSGYTDRLRELHKSMQEANPHIKPDQFWSEEIGSIREAERLYKNLK